MFQLTLFWDFFTIFCKFSEKVFFYQPVNTNKPNFVSLLVFVGIAALFTAKISSFKTVMKQEAILNPILNSEYPRIFRVTEANQNAQKLLFTDLVTTKM